MATESTAQVAPLVILLALLGSIVLYVIVVSPIERERVIGPVYYERYALDTQPGFVKGTPTPMVTYAHEMTPLQLDFSPIATPKLLSEQLSIKRSAVSDQAATFSVSISKAEFASASMDFNVASRRGDKELVIELNGGVVFSGVLEPGKQSVELPADQLLEGSNKLVISAAPPGATFWRSTTYTLSSINFVTRNYDPSKASVEQAFTLTEQESKGFLAARLDAYARQLSTKPATLHLKLNGKEIYAMTLTNATISADLPAYLMKQTNTLLWSIDRGGKYDILFNRIIVNYVKTPYTVKSWKFIILDSETSGAKLGRYTCMLEATASSSASQALIFQINSKTFTLQMKSGTLSEDVCKYLQTGDNYLTVYSPSDIQLDKLGILIKGKV